jgi:N-acetyl-gamma-glutamyl-phosphate reductase
MVKVGIINVTGYAGAEAARLLYGHPEAELAAVTGRGEAGKKLGEVFPHLAAYDLTIEPEIGASVDFVISALPHAASAEACAPLVRGGTPVVDISADFRLKDPAEYREWYGAEHPAQDLLPNAIYGLPEVNREAIRSANLIANPGCYPESAILALAPAIKAGIIGPDIIIDSKSGVSGAGRGAKTNLLLGEAGESVSVYGLDGHRHWPEINQELAALWAPAEAPNSTKPKVSFTPHLIPMTRGILTTAYAPLSSGGAEAYANEPFVRVADSPPSTKQTRGNNMCLVYPTVDVRTERLVVVSVLDNLVKGAAGQAIQNMNLMLGMTETTGLDMLAIYP